jgi:hypothetical protein
MKKNRISLLTIFTLLLITVATNAQPKKNKGFIDAAGVSFYSPYSLDYESTVSYAGIKINVDHYLKSIPRTKAGAEYLIGFNGGYYGKTDYHTDFFINFTGIARYTVKSGFLMEAEANLGIMKRFLDTVEKQKFYEDLGGTGAITAGIGWDLYRASNLPALIKLKGGVLFMYPTNQELYMPVLEINMTYLFGKTFM